MNAFNVPDIRKTSPIHPIAAGGWRKRHRSSGNRAYGKADRWLLSLRSIITTLVNLAMINDKRSPPNLPSGILFDAPGSGGYRPGVLTQTGMTS
ncbi:MAG: hypothetical protein ACLRXB_01280 [Escherichia coli]